MSNSRKQFQIANKIDGGCKRNCSSQKKMALLLKKLFQGYFTLFSEKIDHRTDNLLLMSSPFHPILVGVVYLYLVFKFLPNFMKDRPPFKLDKILIGFNLAQVLINAYIVYYGLIEITKLNWFCAGIDYSTTPHNMFVVRIVHLYFLMKVTDLCDTFFFILRKKMNQVSFLHVYHHFGMIGLGWVGTRFLAGGHSIFLGTINSLVHTIMYFYYLLTIWKPEYKKSIWWKKHITHMQLLQFVFIFFMYGQLLFKNDCGYPKLGAYFIVPQSVFMIILFSDFYWKTYIKPYRKRSVE